MDEHIVEVPTEYQDRPDLKDFKKKKPIDKMKTIFRVMKEDLTLFFDEANYKVPDNQGECRQSLNILEKFGYNEGLLQLLVTDKETGINGDQQDIKRRQAIYGKNKLALKKIVSFMDTFAGTFEDPNVIFLIIVSTVYLAISIWAQSDSYVECLAIFFGLFSVNLISSICDYSKNKQFLGLQDEVLKEKVIVYRGAYGTTDSIKLRNLVVGDVIHVAAGDRVPADCILIDEMDIVVDQTMYHKDQVSIKKSISFKMKQEEPEQDDQGYNTRNTQSNMPQNDDGMQRYGVMDENAFDQHRDGQGGSHYQQQMTNEMDPYTQADPYTHTDTYNDDRENVDNDQYNEGGAEDTMSDQSYKMQKTLRQEQESMKDNHKENPDPFLFTGSMIMQGTGKAVVCAVGKLTRQSRNRAISDLTIKNDATFLEKKLDEAVKQISKYATTIASIVVLSQFIYLTIKLFVNGADSFFVGINIYTKIIIIGVSILIVCIPEGAPLAASIAMALSTNRLKKDKILIKNLTAVQTCSMLHDICVGKTGTITKGKMNVASYQFSDMGVEDNADDNFSTELQISTEMKELISQVIVANTDVRFEPNDKTMEYEPLGQPLEVAMVKFLIDNEIPAHEMLIRRNLNTRKVMNLPFTSRDKMMIVIRDIDWDSNDIRVFVKGAPEYIVPKCEKYYNNQFQLQTFDLEEHILGNHVTDMASRGHKVITYAYKDMTYSDLHQLLEDYNENMEDPGFKQDLTRDLIYLATFGLDDPIRPTVTKSIQLIKYGQVLEDNVDKVKKGIKNQVNIRMVTGDHIETAMSVAEKVGIINPEEKGLNGIAMTGEEFRKKIGEYEKYWDEEEEEWRLKFKSKNKFYNVKSRLRIIARATEEDKLILVQGIKQEGGLVAMSGDKISDATALKMANVGLSMGSGCTVAKENADLVILDNDFNSIHNAIMWGRMIFDNVRKFMQFQLTINISLCLIVILSSMTLGNSPFNVIQLLWINLIMDTLAAIAICTEPYDAKKKNEEVINNRVSRRDKILTASMWRTILTQILYQLMAILILMYGGQAMFYDKPFNLVTEKMRHSEDGPEIPGSDPKKLEYYENDPTDKMSLHTFIFHTFVIMNLFNQINCRVIYEQDKNVFRTLCNNWLFWFIFLFEMLLQQYMVTYASQSKLGQALLSVAPITQGQTIVSWSLGVGSLIVFVASKFIPLTFFKWTDKINLEEDDDDNKLLQWKTLITDTLGTQVKDMDAYINQMDESNISVEHNSDEELGQINGQDDDDDEEEDEEDKESNYTSNSFKAGQGPRSSNVMRYSMRLTEMQKKNKGSKKK